MDRTSIPFDRNSIFVSFVSGRKTPQNFGVTGNSYLNRILPGPYFSLGCSINCKDILRAFAATPNIRFQRWIDNFRRVINSECFAQRVCQKYGVWTRWPPCADPVPFKGRTLGGTPPIPMANPSASNKISQHLGLVLQIMDARMNGGFIERERISASTYLRIFF